MITLDDAIRLFEEKKLATLSQRDRAAAEAFIWQATPKNQRPDRRRSAGIGEYFVANGAESLYEVKQRYQLYRALGTESLLWDEIDRGMLLGTAVRLLKEAERIQKQTGGSLEHAITAALDSYHGPNMEMRRAPSGQRYKVRSPKVRPPSSPFARGRPQMNLFTEVREAVEAYLADALASLPDRESRDVRVEVLTEFDLAVLAAGRAVARAQHLVEEPRREEVRDACLRLGIATPYNGRAPDMHAAKKAYRALVLQLHPDRRGGADDMRDALEACITAYRTIEDYALYLNSKKETAP